MYCIYATICALKTEAPWWYLGCRGCAKKVTPYLNPKTEEIKMDKFCSKKKKKWISSNVTDAKQLFVLKKQGLSLSNISSIYFCHYAKL